MVQVDADGMERVNVEWAIEGRTKTQRGKLYGLHAQELANAKEAINKRARCGDTVTIRLI